MEQVRCVICGSEDHRPLFSKQSRGGEAFTLVKCSRCGMRFVSPRPTGSEIGAYYQGLLLHAADRPRVQQLFLRRNPPRDRAGDPHEPRGPGLFFVRGRAAPGPARARHRVRRGLFPWLHAGPGLGRHGRGHLPGLRRVRARRRPCRVRGRLPGDIPSPAPST